MTFVFVLVEAKLRWQHHSTQRALEVEDAGVGGHVFLKVLAGEESTLADSTVIAVDPLVCVLMVAVSLLGAE